MSHSWNPLRRFLLTGLVSGLIAGVGGGIFLLLFVEPTISRAIAVEQTSALARDTAATSGFGSPVDALESNEADESESDEAELVSRRGQLIGGFVGTVVGGGVWGSMFGLLCWGTSRTGGRGFDGMERRSRRRSTTDHFGWRRTVALAGACFVSVSLVPFVAYPANPPGVGDPQTIARRSGLYLAALVGSVSVSAIAWAAWGFAKRRGFGAAMRCVLAACCYIALVVAMMLALPPAETASAQFPSGLLLEFRVRSLALLAVVWGLIGLVFSAFGWVGGPKIREASQRQDG